jgi:hypothetical protein
MLNLIAKAGNHGIKLSTHLGNPGLDGEVEEAPQELTSAVLEEWREVHEARRGRGVDSIDELSMMRLARHDQEMFVGVVRRRVAGKTSSSLGYSSWWLTLDKAAFKITEKVNQRIEAKIKSPVMSPDFLLNYLAMGPSRFRIPKNTESTLSIMIEGRLMEAYPAELVDLAEEARKEYQNLPERVIRRMVRDQLDKAKMRAGAIAEGGISRMEREILERIGED